MTTVNFTVGEDHVDGIYLSPGIITCRPVTRRVSQGVTVTRTNMVVSLRTKSSLDLAGTDLGQAWRITIMPDNGDVIDAYFKVPFDGPVDFRNLVQVDPNTLDEVAKPDAEWWAVARATVNSGKVEGDNLILTRTDGVEVNAGNVRGPEGVRGEDGDIGPRGLPGIKGDPGESFDMGKAVELSYRHATLNSIPYTDIRVANALVNPGTVKKIYANDSPTASIAVLETPESVFDRTGYGFVSNGGGWNTETNLLRGLQIKDGVLIQDFDSWTNYSLGVRADGSMRIYTYPDWDGVAVLGDGVVNTFSFGLAYVINGEKNPLVTDSTTLSARTIMGWKGDDLHIIKIEGVSGVSGASQVAARDLAFDLGLENALNLDGGGSSQSLINGFQLNPSSDSVQRAVGDLLAVNVPYSGKVASRWVSPALAENFTSHTVPPQVRVADGVVESQGAIINGVQNGGTVQAMTYPWWARPVTYQRLPLTMGTNPAFFDVATTGVVSRFLNTQSSSVSYINSVSFPVK